MKLSTLSKTAVALSLTAAALTGCIVAPVGPGAYYGDPTVVAVAPPPPRYEVVGVAPVVGAIWIAGFWNWAGGRHVWVGGHWDSPRPGYRWTPHRWEPVARGGWRLNGGRWDRG